MTEDFHHRIIEVKEAWEDCLLALEGVHMVSIGYKMVDGKQSDELAIIIHTDFKKEEDEIAARQRIPSSIQGILTDVVEMPPFEPLPIEFYEPYPEHEKYRPVPGGAEIYMPSGPFTGGLCTLGMFAHSLKPRDDPNDIYLLSNAHCFYQPDQIIRQPESNSLDDDIAYAIRVVNSEMVDGGIGQMLQNEEADPYAIINIGPVTGVYDVTLSDIGRPVIKTGRTTGTTIGTIAYLQATADDKRRQIIIRDENGAFSEQGDSGSVVLLANAPNTHNVIGLLWGGALEYSVLSPILAVTEELQIELITTENIA